MRKILSILAICLTGLGMVACGSSGTVATTPLPQTGSSVNGLAAKGPMAAGGMIEVFQLTNGVRGVSPIATAVVTDNLGSYSITLPQGTTGPVEMVVTGSYYNEVTGTNDPSQSLSVVLATVTGNALQANANIITSVAAEIFKLLEASNNLTSVENLASANDLAMQMFGMNLNVNGATDPSAVDVINTGASGAACSNAQALGISAAIADAIANGTLNSPTLAAFAANAAQDAINGLPLGTTGGDVAALNASLANVNANMPAIAANMTSLINSAGGTADPNLQNNLQACVPPGSFLTAVRGIGLSGNQVTIGSNVYGYVTGTVDAYGQFSLVGNPASGYNISFALDDYSSADGQSAGPAVTVTGSMVVDVYSKNDSRTAHAVISPVKYITDGAGLIDIQVDAYATAVVSGTDATGQLTVNGTITNPNTDVFTNHAGGKNTVSVNMQDILNRVETQLGLPAGTVTLSTGVYVMSIGFSAPFGHESAAGPLDNLFPTDLGTGAHLLVGTVPLRVPLQ